ncbi:effector binding domain-containing protein [Gracilibacillus alcaliphilus]|uniref:effector binding domain-containing protein n=1 Tax=Gracilibacillus alcaliphilus TaxID=1401441 RepID=UPI001EF997B2|nr:effector binding domain-containing protein [Gracilibacillus alcaliphilus]MBM7676603.1 putative transcriptional regulator YdeE [Gracilibacillus alcaliphilus]
MQIKHRQACEFIGRSIEIEGKGVHDPGYSQEKTAFYKKLFQIGMMKELMPLSKDKKGYAVIIPIEKGIRYFAGVLSDNNLDGYEQLEIASQDYTVFAAQEGLSRHLFDQLEDRFFSDKEQAASYNGKEILEVLVNGDPANAEVELWVPITRD